MHLVLAVIAVLAFASPVRAGPLPPAPGGACAPGLSGLAPRVIETELAGVPVLIRVPPDISAPPIVLWHGFGPPDSEGALMALLPLDDVPAVKIYAGLPMFGKRSEGPGAVAQRQARDLATEVFAPVVMGAARELQGMADALRRQGCLRPGQGIGLFGFSAGGAAVLFALAERDVPVEAALVLNASTGLSASVAAYERALGRQFDWTPEARSLARRSDAGRRAADIARGEPPPALLIVHGAKDAMVDAAGASALHGALEPHYAGKAAGRLELNIVPELAHALHTPDDIALVRSLAGAWFRRFMTAGNEEAGTGPGNQAAHPSPRGE